MDGSVVGRANLDAIQKDIAALRKDLGNLLGQVKVDTTQSVNGELRRIRHSLDAKRESAASAVSQYVDERPITSLMIAFAVGFIGSKILPR